MNVESVIQALTIKRLHLNLKIKKSGNYRELLLVFRVSRISMVLVVYRVYDL